jgi:hypothetical protein
MAESKYVVVDSVEEGEQIFVFPKAINHDEFAEVLSYIKSTGRRGPQDWIRVHRLPISAGFTDLKTCYGRSESLGLDSRPEDAKLLTLGSFQ